MGYSIKGDAAMNMDLKTLVDEELQGGEEILWSHMPRAHPDVIYHATLLVVASLFSMLMSFVVAELCGYAVVLDGNKIFFGLYDPQIGPLFPVYLFGYFMLVIASIAYVDVPPSNITRQAIYVLTTKRLMIMTFLTRSTVKIGKIRNFFLEQVDIVKFYAGNRARTQGLLMLDNTRFRFRYDDALALYQRLVQLRKE